MSCKIGLYPAGKEQKVTKSGDDHLYLRKITPLTISKTNGENLKIDKTFKQ